MYNYPIDNGMGLNYTDTQRRTNMSNMIYKKMSDVMKDVGAIGKDQKNTQQGFKFRGIDQFVNALYPALTKHGVFMSPRATSFTHELKDVVRGSGKSGVDKHVSIMMEYDFYAEDGSKVTIGPVPAEGLDSGDKATNKALSAALKYALIQTFSIPTEDMAEADFDSPEIGTTKTAVATATAVNTDNLTAEVKPTPKVEPLKKSSFRKPKAETTTSTANAWTNGSASSSEEWS